MNSECGAHVFRHGDSIILQMCVPVLLRAVNAGKHIQKLPICGLPSEEDWEDGLPVCVCENVCALTVSKLSEDIYVCRAVWRLKLKSSLVMMVKVLRVHYVSEGP